MVMDFFYRLKETRAEAKATRESLERQQAYEAQSKRRAAYEREQRIATVRVITGDLKHRYIIVDTLRGFGLYTAQPGRDYDPTEATRRALYHLQTQAHDIGADAVIHARYEILRYAEPRQLRQAPVPTYEVHAFGTAVKVVGPPADWPADTGTSRDVSQEDSPDLSEA